MAKPTRSAAAAAASRCNGSRSTGPSSEVGKATSARNSVKHGLFSSPGAGHIHSEGARSLASAVAGAAGGAAPYHLMAALDAWARLEQVIAILDGLNADLDAALTSGGGDLEGLVEQIVRMGRYERRFRGQRDRAMRSALGGPDAQE